MEKIVLEVAPRAVVGKKVKKLRQEGLLPVSVYGKDVSSVALTVPISKFAQVYSSAGETGLVELKFDGRALTTLIANVQYHPVTRQVLHAEFHAVKLTEKIKAKVPVETIGESPVVANNVGLILQTLSEVEVEALPAKLPDKVSVDVSWLSEVGQQVTVGQLAVPSEVTLLTSAGEVVLRVVPAVSEETQKELAAEEAAKAAAASEALPAAEAAEEQAAVVEEVKAPEETKE